MLSLFYFRYKCLVGLVFCQNPIRQITSGKWFVVYCAVVIFSALWHFSSLFSTLLVALFCQNVITCIRTCHIEHVVFIFLLLLICILSVLCNMTPWINTLSLPAEHRPQTTCLHQAQFHAAAGCSCTRIPPSPFTRCSWVVLFLCGPAVYTVVPAVMHLVFIEKRLCRCCCWCVLYMVIAVILLCCRF